MESISNERLSQSVISVPPLARNADGSLNVEENRKIVEHLRSGGVSTFLYGGNAILYHIAPSEYKDLLAFLSELAEQDQLVIPSVGPSYGVMMEQAKQLAEFDFATAMLLPTRDVCTSVGVERAIREFVDVAQRPAVLYIKHDGYVDVATVARLVKDNLLSWIKYAVVRPDTADDPFLRELIAAVGTERIISGIGEQPAITHMREFGLAGFTSGCVCVAPGRSMEMLRAIRAGQWEEAESIRKTFSPLEDLRNEINPVRVLHTAVALAGIANTGPILPLLCEVSPADQGRIQVAAASMLEWEKSASV